jgi:hypothetical protein
MEDPEDPVGLVAEEDLVAEGGLVAVVPAGGNLKTFPKFPHLEL